MLDFEEFFDEDDGHNSRISGENEYRADSKLSKKQAAHIIERFAIHHAAGDLPHSSMTLSALRIAVDELLKDDYTEAKGVWLRNNDDTHFCEYCGHDAAYERVSDTWFNKLISPYCPYCGHPMSMIED